ncbi:MAG TPA: hypothetical protein VII82_12825, partial [Polyangiaceae bacterium]
MNLSASRVATLLLFAAGCGTGSKSTPSGRDGGIPTSENGGVESDADTAAQTDAQPLPGTDAGRPPASNRVDVNMGATPWKFLQNKNPDNAQSPIFDDSTWTDTGVPHTWNDADTFVNGQSGGGTMAGGTNWYRKHFTLDAAYANRKILVEFEGVHVGA